MTDEKLDAEQLAKLTEAFLKTPLGKHYLTQLGMIYNALHQDAESDGLTSEQKAFKAERAAGLKLAINWLTAREKLLQGGYFDT